MTQPASFWKNYDIRGVVGEHFGPKEYFRLGQAYAGLVTQSDSGATVSSDNAQGNAVPWVAVGHDARLHAKPLVEALIQGLTESGVNVLFLGLSTSPIVYFAEYLHEQNSEIPTLVGTVVVTASHNPSEYNGAKFTFQKRAMTKEEFFTLKRLYNETPENPEVSSEPMGAKTKGHGSIQPLNSIPIYMNWFDQQFSSQKTAFSSLKVVVDCGNATGGIVAPQILKRLGCEVIELFTEPDGNFPNHHPDPCVPKNLVTLIDTVREHQAHIGFAFDGDADRVGVVDNQGNIFPGDIVTLFLAEDLLRTHPGEAIAMDVKSTQHMMAFIEDRGGKPFWVPSGHVLMKRMMKEHNILLGGEFSGHLFFRDRHWGFDDALYGACRILEALAFHRQEKPGYALSDFLDNLPHSLISDEIRIDCPTEADVQKLISNLKERLDTQPDDFLGFPVLDVLTLDGIRVNFKGGFFLLRKSGTEPCVTLRFEAPEQIGYQRIEKGLAGLCSFS